MANKSAEATLERLRKFLWWDHENECWKESNKDPSWNGYDELDRIADILIEDGFGNPSQETGDRP